MAAQFKVRRRVSLRRAARPPVGPVSPAISGPNGLPGAVPGPGLGMVRTGPRQRGHASVPVHGLGPRARPGCVQADRSVPLAVTPQPVSGDSWRLAPPIPFLD